MEARDLAVGDDGGMTEKANRSHKQKRLWYDSRWLIVFFCGVLLLCMWAIIWRQIQREYSEEIGNAGREATNLAWTCGEYVRRTIQMTDYGMGMALLGLNYEKGKSRFFDAAGLGKMPGVQGWMMADENGEVIVSSPGTYSLDWGERKEHVAFHQKGNGRLYVGKPVLYAGQDRYYIPLSRGIWDPEGQFRGILLVALRAEFFTSFFQPVNLGPDKMITITGLDGVVRARVFHNQPMSGMNAEQGILVQSARQRESAVLVGPSVVDNILRIQSYQVLLEYDLAVSVGISFQDLMQNFEARKKNYQEVGILGSLFILAFGGLILWRGGLQEQLQKEIEEDARRMRLLQSTTSRLVSPTEDGQALLKTILTDMLELIGAPDGHLSLLKETDHAMYILCASGIHETRVGERIPLEQNLHGQTFESGEIVYINDYRQFPHRLEDDRISHMTSVVTVPLKSPRQVVGIILASWTHQVYQPNEKDMALLKQYGALAEIAVERQIAADNLRFSEEKFSKAFLYSSDAIGIIRGDDGLCMEISDVFFRKFGYSREEIIGRFIGDTELWGSEWEFDAFWTLAKKREPLQDVETIWCSKAGEMRTGMLSGDWGVINGEHCLLFIWHDVTERKQGELILRESEERLRQAVIHAPFPLIIHSEDGEVLMISHTVTELTEYQKEEIASVRKLVRRMFGDKWQTAKRNLDGVHNKTARMELGEYQVITRSGNVRTWIFTATPLNPLPDGRRIAMTMAVDITDRKTMLEELKAKNQELDQFAYVVSHDLKAPLRAIASLVSWIEEDLREDYRGEIKENLEYLRGRVRRMENLIEGILAYSRIGRVNVAREQVDVQELLKEIIDDLNPPPGYAVVVETEMPVLVAAKILLRQVFSNLVDNAIKYHQGPNARISIGCRRERKWVVFWVKDDGPGIAPDYHEKIFGLFQTLQPRDKLESTGIGLTMVRKIVEEQGGQITVTSQTGEGACFTFTWPRYAVK